MMCSPPDAVAIHQMVARLVDAKKVVEVGVFTGYTALGMALVLPKNGKLVACDVHEQWPKIGAQPAVAIEGAGSDKVDS